MAEINADAFLKVGDKFSVETFKTLPSKKYNDRLNAKILTTTGEVKWTSAANIIKILSAFGEGSGESDGPIDCGQARRKHGGHDPAHAREAAAAPDGCTGMAAVFSQPRKSDDGVPVSCHRGRTAFGGREGAGSGGTAGDYKKIKNEKSHREIR